LANRLAQESSPYLRQHAENPVDWLPWGEEALLRARQLDRPIFLSIGYAACHWCHVMAHESFEDGETAALLNREFVPVKVDREERPDIDTIYMDAVVAMTGQGGWPLSIFLTPDGHPFFGGTYFPPVARYRLPSFREVLQSIATAWRSDRPRVLAAGRSLMDVLIAAPPAATSERPLDPALVPAALETLLRAYDWDYGGWGGAPKFPQTPVLLLLLDRHRRAGDRMALDMARHALSAMAAGGIADQLGGGFHRYSVDARWTVPHFEKMLYDNALLARAYLRAWRATREPRFRDVAEATLGFLYRDLRDPRGPYYSSLDADSQGGEGVFYTWTPAEIADALRDPAQARLARRGFGVTQQGNLEGRTVLRLPAPGAQAGTPSPEVSPVEPAVLEDLRRRLFEARGHRPRPALDDKIVAAWNGLALIAFAEAAQTWGRAEDLAAAQRLGAFLLNELSPSGALLRSERAGQPGPRAFLEDHAAVGLGLLTLYQTDFDERWFVGAVAQAEAVLTRFVDSTGTFFDTPSDHEELLTRPRSVQDSPTPSGGAMAVELLLTLNAFTGEDRYSLAALAALSAIQETAAAHPTAFASWLNDLQAALSSMRQLALIGDPAAGDFQSLLQALRLEDPAGLVIAAAREGQASTIPLLADRHALQGRATAYLCEHFTCRLPVTTPEDLQSQLRQAASPVPAP
jgi:uncharacterized protein YyaL (SSP411 family)